MEKELSITAQSLLETLQEDSLIEPDDWHFTIKAGGRRIPCTPQLKRSLIRETLIEINNYKPKFLSPQFKKEFNLFRLTDGNDLIPTIVEIARLEKKLRSLSEENEYYIKKLSVDPSYTMENTIVSAWMIDIQDLIDYLNGEKVEEIYFRITRRRKEIDKP